MRKNRKQRHVQISFIGSAHKSVHSDQGKQLYKQTTYVFDHNSGAEKRFTTSLFPLALGAYLAELGRRVDCLLLIGTHQSNWDVLSCAVPEKDRDCVADWANRVANNTDALASIPRQLLEHMPCGELRCEVVPDAREHAGQRAFMNSIIKHVQPGDRIILDTTHALRHMPVMTAFLVNALHWLDGDVQVSDMYYGAWELRSGSEDAPVVNLRIAADYADMGAAMAAFHTTGSYHALAQHFPKLQPTMERVDFLEGIHRLDQAQEGARDLHKSFQGWPEEDEDPYRKEVVRRIKGEWEWAENNTPERYMLEQARRFLRHGEYLKCASILHEVFFVHIERLVPDIDHNNPKKRTNELKKHMIRHGEYGGLTTKEAKRCFSRFCRLGKLRNKLMHYRPMDGRDDTQDKRVMEALSDRNKMEALLQDSIELGEWWLRTSD